MGSLRTVIFGFLIAKTESPEGKFILRIEDTDQKRKVEGAVDEIIKILDWVGIEFYNHRIDRYGTWTITNAPCKNVFLSQDSCKW